jgi:membrane-bound lytic murein transglycosylase D
VDRFICILFFAFLFIIKAQAQNPESPPVSQALDLPAKMVFAGEKVPLERADVAEGLDRELHINTFWQSNMLLMIKRANRYFPEVEEILKKNNIPDDFKYLPLIESAFLNVVSPSGAEGFWQFIPETGRHYGLEITKEVDERYDVKKSTEAACRYLQEAYNKLGSWALAAAAYNRGTEGMQNAIDAQRVNSYYDLYLNEQTSRYVFRILAVKEIMEHPAKYGFHYHLENLYVNSKTFNTTIDSSITDLPIWAIHHGFNYKILREYNPWIQTYHLTVAPGKSYIFELPDNKDCFLFCTPETTPSVVIPEERK